MNKLDEMPDDIWLPINDTGHVFNEEPRGGGIRYVRANNYVRIDAASATLQMKDDRILELENIIRQYLNEPIELSVMDIAELLQLLEEKESNVD